MVVYEITEEKYVVITHYAPVNLIAYIVEVCDLNRANEHIKWDMTAEIQWEKEQDMLADAREQEYADREPEYDEEW